MMMMIIKGYDDDTRIQRTQLMSHHQWQHHTIDDSKSDTYHEATTLLLENRRLRARAPEQHRRILCTKG